MTTIRLPALWTTGIALVGTVMILTVGCSRGSGDSSDQKSEVRSENSHEGYDHSDGDDHTTNETGFAATLTSDWCFEHSVPESQCTKCHPALIDKFKATGDWCGGHNLPESHCRICNPGLRFAQEELILKQTFEEAEQEIMVSLFFRPNQSVCATDGALIQFASAQTAQRAGITIQRARSANYEISLTAPAEVAFDETHATVVNSTVSASVARWLVEPGDRVRRGDVLALLHSPQIVELRAELVRARAAYEVEEQELVRHRELKSRNLISDSDYERQVAAVEQARAQVVSIRGVLSSAGLSESEIDASVSGGNLSNMFVLRAPSAGLVVERIAPLGKLLGAGEAFALLADPSAMWVEARLTEELLRRVSVGQRLTFASDGHSRRRVGAEVIWVSRFLDPHTRMGTVRARVIDRDHDLQAGEFGRVTFLAQESKQVTLVPKDAVQWEGCCNVVFVKETEDRYRPRKVHLLEGSGPYYQISHGLKPGEDVVVHGAFLLKTELKKTSIGAGCCGIEPAG